MSLIYPILPTVMVNVTYQNCCSISQIQIDVAHVGQDNAIIYQSQNMLEFKFPQFFSCGN
jgi:hypothetical protein